jgi:hypothetical protein
MEHTNRRPFAQIGVGVFLLLAGVALMLGKFDFFYTESPWHFWPVIILAAGIGKLIDAEFSWEYRKAIWTLFIGGWLLVSELHLFGLSYHNSWPILLIGVGIGMMWKSIYPNHPHVIKEQGNGN